MPNTVKKQKIDELIEKTKNSKAIYFADYRGLPVNEIQKLRRKINETNSELQVTKNTLIKIALEKNGVKLEKDLEGPSIVLFAYEDEILPLKTIIDFSKTNEKELPKIKVGIFDGKYVDNSTLVKLSQIPGKQVLLTQLVTLMESPIQKFMRGLNYHTLALINVLNQIKDKKGKN